MNWPNHTDYQDAIQNPQFNFTEPDLKTAEVACDMLGLPKVMSGNFASVYEVRSGNSRWAIRCFVRQVTGQQARYAILTKHLAAVNLPSLVKFEFVAKGILVRNDHYPIVRMDWVSGAPLHMYVEDHFQDSAHMEKLAVQWRDLMQGLRNHRIAHGDLQHGNVMVTPEGEFRLVDYDGMYVPAFGRGRSPELGHLNYQHPRRTADFYEESLDNFSALVIQTSFLALAKEPVLWGEFSTGDNLLFVGADFQRPQQSKVLKRLKESPDPQVRMLAELLEWCCLRPIASVPDFLETMRAVDEGRLPVDVSANAEPIPAAAPGWLAEEVPIQARGEGSRPAPSGIQGSRPSPTSPTSSVMGSRPATTSAWSGSRAAENSDSVAPVQTAVVTASDLSPPLNLPAIAAAGLALLAFIPQLHVAAGALAALCGLAGFIKGASHPSPLRWVGLTAALIGGMFAASGLGNKKSPALVETPAAEESAETVARGPSPTIPVPTKPGGLTPSLPLPSQPPISAPVPAPAAVPAEVKIRSIGALKGHRKLVESICFSHDGASIASGANDGTVCLWDADSGELKRTLPGLSEGVSSIVFSTDNSRVFAVGADNLLVSWNPADGKLIRTTKEHQKTIWPIALSSDGSWLASGAGNRKQVNLSELISGAAKGGFVEQSSWVKTVDFSPDSSFLAVQLFDDTVRVWDRQNFRAGASFTISSNMVGRVCFSHDANRVAAGLDGRAVGVWESLNGQLRQRFAGATAEVRSLAFSSTDRSLVAGDQEGGLRIWDLASGALRGSVSAHPGGLYAIAVSPNGKRMATGGGDTLVRLWDSAQVP